MDAETEDLLRYLFVRWLVEINMPGEIDEGLAFIRDGHGHVKIRYRLRIDLDGNPRLCIDGRFGTGAEYKQVGMEVG